MSADLLDLQEAISLLQDAEEDLLDTHVSVIEDSSRWFNMDKSLLTMTKEVDYDVDGE